MVGHRRFGCEDLGLLVGLGGGCARDNFSSKTLFEMGGIGGVGEQYWPALPTVGLVAVSQGVTI